MTPDEKSPKCYSCDEPFEDGKLGYCRECYSQFPFYRKVWDFANGLLNIIAVLILILILIIMLIGGIVQCCKEGCQPSGSIPGPGSRDLIYDEPEP